MFLAQIIHGNLWCCLGSPASFQFARRRTVGAVQNLEKAKRGTSILLYHRKLSTILQTTALPRHSSSTENPPDNDFFRSHVNLTKTLQASNLEDTYEKLKVWSRRANYVQVQTLVDRLVRIYGERPNNRIYEALILANADALHGSPGEMAKILQEMEEEGLSLDSGTYHAALKVLAVHPDHLLRSHILKSLRQHWFSLTKEGYQDVVVGLVRERQVELALEYLERMLDERIAVSSWLYDLSIYALCNMEEFDEAMRVLHQRLKTRHEVDADLLQSDEYREFSVSSTLWYYILDTASRARHHAATLQAYNAQVASSQLIPSIGMCNNILACAAQSGDPQLATSVFDILSQRSGSPIQLQHYEALLEAYINASDLSAALSLLSTMATSGHPPTQSSTCPILVHLTQSTKHTATAFYLLEKLRDQGRPIPLVALNLIIEAYLCHGNLQAAMSVYNKLDLFTKPSTSSQQNFTPQKPNTTTYNLLLRGCRFAGDKPRAMFLACEMVALEIPPDSLTYDRLVLVCLHSDVDLNDAWRYVEEMREAGFELRQGTLNTLASRARELGDERGEMLKGRRKRYPVERKTERREEGSVETNV